MLLKVVFAAKGNDPNIWRLQRGPAAGSVADVSGIRWTRTTAHDAGECSDPSKVRFVAGWVRQTLGPGREFVRWRAGGARGAMGGLARRAALAEFEQRFPART